jgi:cell division topological specificity factor
MFPWFKKKSSASTAKDRLTIAIMSDRDNTSHPYMAQMKAEIIEVVKKYIGVRTINITKDVEGDFEALSIEVQLDKNA